MTPETTTSQNVRHVEGSEQIAKLVRDAVSSATPIVDYGVAHGGLGHPPPADHLKFKQGGQIIEHYHRDLTVRIAAGTLLGPTQARLADHHQFLPLDADGDLTIGEVIQHNVYGPLRASYGAARDLLLGLSYVDGQGRLITAGGRTVKNVAGYDVTRFMVGSLGELGVVTEATLRTYALPHSALEVELQVHDPAKFDQILARWMITDAAPSWISLQTKDGSFYANLAYLGWNSATQVQFRSLGRMVDDEATIQINRWSEHPFADDQRIRADRRAWRRTAPAVVKVVVPPASSGLLCKSLSQTPDRDPVCRIEALPLHGCVFIGGPLEAEHAERLDQQIRRLIRPTGGFRVWIRRPGGAEGIEPFAPPQPDWPMLQRIKNALDPHGVLNPNRFLKAPTPERALA